jgi:hypothetical protein
MAKDLGDLRQGRPGPQHLGCRRVTKAVRRRIGNSGSDAGTVEHPAEDPGVGEADERCVMPEEDATAGALGPASLEVAGQRLADVGRKRKAFLAAALSAHQDLASAPIKIVKLEPDDFTAA